MGNRQKPTKRTPPPAPQPNKPQPNKPQQQGRLRKAFTVIICVVVALGLMMPIAGIGVASCSGPAASGTGDNGSASGTGGSVGGDIPGAGDN
jgi:ABC-type Fe3+ transport system permease subunit